MEGQQHAILQYIPYGYENAISRQELSEKCGMKDRQMRKAIEDAVKDGHIILNLQTGSGYFQIPEGDAATLWDIVAVRQNYTQEKNRLVHIARRLKAEKKWLKSHGISVK